MWNNYTQQQMKPHEGISPRVRFPIDSLHFLHPLSPSFHYYVESGSPVYAFPYPMGNSWPLYQSPRGIGRLFGLVPETPRSPRMISPRIDVAAESWRVAAAMLSPVIARGSLNVSSMSTTRGIDAEDLSLKIERFKVRIVELGDDHDLKT